MWATSLERRFSSVGAVGRWPGYTETMCSMNMTCKLSFPGLRSLCHPAFSPGRLTQQDGRGAGGQVQSGTWEQARLPRPGCRRDAMPLRRMKSSGAEATWLREPTACSREGETEGGRQVGRVG